MQTLLFFDDQRLFVREGLTRAYGKPTLLAASLFADPGTSPGNAFVSAWKADDGRTHLFYQANVDGGHVFLAAISEDGIHFTPRNTAKEAGIENPLLPNQLLPRMDGELGAVLCDPSAPADRRLKALVCLYQHESLDLRDVLYESGDGIHWTLAEGVRWNTPGTEPGVGGYYNPVDGKSVIISRPFWGVRRLCYIETVDFRTFTRPRLVLQCDALDQPLDESYGMPCFFYKGIGIGLFWIYHVPAGDTWKYAGGTVDCQLAYSFNGSYWLRSLREPFIGTAEAPFSGMVYPSAAGRDANGDLLLYASGTSAVHGDFSRDDARVGVYRLREDGFIRLETGPQGTGRLMTRQLLLQGPLSINLEADSATCAIRDRDSRPIEGFDHVDCTPFSGDARHWRPAFRESLAGLYGKVVTIEVCVTGGALYAIEGEFVSLMNTEALRYERFGVMPQGQGL